MFKRLFFFYEPVGLACLASVSVGKRNNMYINFIAFIWQGGTYYPYPLP